MEYSWKIPIKLYPFSIPQGMWMHKRRVCFWAHCGAKHLAWRPNIPTEFLCDPIPFGWHCPTLFQLWNFHPSRDNQRTNTIKSRRSWISCWFWVFHCFFPNSNLNQFSFYIYTEFEIFNLKKCILPMQHEDQYWRLQLIFLNRNFEVEWNSSAKPNHYRDHFDNSGWFPPIKLYCDEVDFEIDRQISHNKQLACKIIRRPSTKFWSKYLYKIDHPKTPWIYF